MIGALFRRNLAHHGRLLGALAGGMVAFEMLLVGAAARLETGSGVAALEQLLPPSIRDLVLTQFGMASFAGAVAFGFQHPVSLVACLAFVIVAATLPAAERESGFLDLVLARPVSRATYLSATLALVAVGALVLPAALLTGLVLGLAVVDVSGEPSWMRYLPSAAGLAALLFAVGGGTLALAAGNPRRGPAVARAVGLLLALFLVEFLADLLAPFARLRWVSVFHYFKPVSAALEGGLRWQQLAVLASVFAAGFGTAVLRFRRQDL